MDYSTALIYLVTLIQCFRWLIFTDEGWKPRERINSVTTLTTIFIFWMSTINLITSLTCYYLEEYLRSNVSWFQDGMAMIIVCLAVMVFKQTVNIALQNISKDLARISVDGVLIYRCWVVYAKSWRVICVPVALWLAELVFSVLQFYYAELDYKGQGFEIALISMKTLTGLFACNIAITIYSTAAIIYRILSSTRNIGGNHKRLNYAMQILAESGFLYTSMTIFSLVGLTLGAREDSTWVEWLISSISDNMGFSMGSISFNWILIRVYQSRVELRHSFPDSKDDYELSGIPFNNLQITASSEGPSSGLNALDEAVDEVQEHRRSRERMHED